MIAHEKHLKKRYFESFSDRVLPMVAFSISVFVSVQNDLLPNKGVCVTEESFGYNIFQSMLFSMPERVCLLSLNIGQWRRKWEVFSIFKPQLQS